MGLGHGSIIEYVSLEMADIRKSAAIFFISIKLGLIKGVGGITVQTGCSYISLLAQSIHLREKNIAGPTERPKSSCFFGSQGRNLRFSMKMMFATAYETSIQPV